MISRSCFFGLPPARRILAELALFAFFAAARAEDWPRWRGPDLNGISTETNWTWNWPKEGPKQLWKASVGTGFSSVAVAHGRAFTLGNKDGFDTVFALDAQTGKEIWKQSYPCPLDSKYYEGGPGSTPTVDGAKVYTLSKRGQVFCFTAPYGRILWAKNLMEDLGAAKPQWGYAGSPLVADGNLLVLNVGGAGTALRKATGDLAWKSGTNAAGYASPIPFRAGGERGLLLFSGKALVAVRAEDGRELWSYPWITHWDINAADPILIGTKLFLSTFDRGCALLELSSGKPVLLWENKEMANHFNSCVFLNGHFFGINGNTDVAERDLRCLDLATGQVKWKQAGFGMGSLMAANGKLIILGEKGELAVAEAAPEAFKPLARAQVMGGKCWTTPVLANGRLYCRNAEGTLICLDVSRPETPRGK